MVDEIRVAVLGAGNVGYAVAADLALAGHSIVLYSPFKDELTPIIKDGGIKLVKNEKEEFVKLEEVTTSVEEALRSADLVLIAVVASAHETIAKLCAPYLRDGQLVVMLAGYAGSLIFDKVIKKKKKKVLLAETETAPYACRKSEGKAEVRIYLTTKPALGVFPAKEAEKVIELVKHIYPKLRRAKNVLEAGLSNPNITWHVPATLLNAGWIEASKGEFYLWRQGITSSVLEVIKAVYDEKDAIFNTLGYIDHAPMEQVKKAQENPSFQEIKGPTSLEL